MADSRNSPATTDRRAATHEPGFGMKGCPGRSGARARYQYLKGLKPPFGDRYDY